MLAGVRNSTHGLKRRKATPILESVRRSLYMLLIGGILLVFAAVAGRYGQACTSEIDFIRTVLPDATVTRVSHMVSGDRRCTYRMAPAQ